MTRVVLDRWVIHEHINGSTIHDRDCPYVDETMQPHPWLRKADREQVVAFCRVARRIQFCKRCAKRKVD